MKSSRAPIVGVSTYRESAGFVGWHLEVALLPTSYIDSLHGVGAAPILLPSLEGLHDAYLDRIDALVLSGGSDIDPAFYGHDLHPMGGSPRRLRDKFELELLAGALERKMPVLAICRGLQILNVQRGGTLHQHLPEIVGNHDHDSVPGGFGTHKVTIKSPSTISKIIHEQTIEVPAHHHQAIASLGRDLAVTATSDDGVIEAVEDPSYGFLVAVQWHPEVGQDKSLFAALAEAAMAPR